MLEIYSSVKYANAGVLESKNEVLNTYKDRSILAQVRKYQNKMKKVIISVGIGLVAFGAVVATLSTPALASYIQVQAYIAHAMPGVANLFSGAGALILLAGIGFVSYGAFKRVRSKDVKAFNGLLEEQAATPPEKKS